MNVLIGSFQTGIYNINFYIYMGMYYQFFSKMSRNSLPKKSFVLIPEVTHLCKSNKNFIPSIMFNSIFTTAK